jgi:hypothetical protein
LVEAFTVPGGVYLLLGQPVDLEVEVHVFVDRTGVPRSRLRLCGHTGQF